MSCIACGAPGAEAPDLIEHDGINGHCYFKKPPETEDEISRAVLAMNVSCIAALRYGGTDESILRRLYENGMEDMCDHVPAQKYSFVNRNRVTFTFIGSLQDLCDALISRLPGINSGKSVRREETGRPDRFRLIYRWLPNLRGVIYEGRLEGDREFSLFVRPEGTHGKEGIGNNILLYDLLAKDERVSEMKWWPERPRDNQYYDKPF